MIVITLTYVTCIIFLCSLLVFCSIGKCQRCRWHDGAERNRVVNTTNQSNDPCTLHQYVFDTACDTDVISVEINIIMLEHLRPLTEKEIVLSLQKTGEKPLLL